MKTLVAYYSKGGNNEYLARKIAGGLGADLEAIKPRAGGMFFQLIFTAMGSGFGARKPAHDVSSYDRVILCAPLWMGSLAYPAVAFAKKHGKRIKSLCVASCCASADADKDSRFGFERAFSRVRAIAPAAFAFADAFPVGLVAPAGATDSQTLMDVRLSDANFAGPIADRLARFLERAGA